MRAKCQSDGFFGSKNEERQAERFKVYQRLLTRYRKEGHAFLNHIIAYVEMKIYDCTPESLRTRLKKLKVQLAIHTRNSIL